MQYISFKIVNHFNESGNDIYYMWVFVSQSAGFSKIQWPVNESRIIYIYICSCRYRHKRLMAYVHNVFIVRKDRSMNKSYTKFLVLLHVSYLLLIQKKYTLTLRYTQYILHLFHERSMYIYVIFLNIQYFFDNMYSHSWIFSFCSRNKNEKCCEYPFFLL